MVDEEVEEVVVVMAVAVVVVVKVLTYLDLVPDGIEQILVFTVGHTGRATIPAMHAQTAIQVIRPLLRSIII